MCTIVHAAAPPVGSVEASALPAASTATHSPVEGHETPRTNTGPALSVLFCVVLGSTWATTHAAAPPVGSVEVITLPAASTATHRVVDGHETLVISIALSTSAAAHARGPPAGSVDQRTCPARSTATHSAVDGHAMLSIGCMSTSPGAVHSSGPGLLAGGAACAAGTVVRPSASIATPRRRVRAKRARPTRGNRCMERRTVARLTTTSADRLAQRRRASRRERDLDLAPRGRAAIGADDRDPDEIPALVEPERVALTHLLVGNDALCGQLREDPRPREP